MTGRAEYDEAHARPDPTVPADVRCDRCNGWGVVWEGDYRGHCPSCGGSGKTPDAG